MQTRRLRIDPPPHAEQHGVMIEGTYFVDYYVTQPSPGRWIAVGLVQPLRSRRGDSTLARMLVGEGPFLDEAIASLRERVRDLPGHRWDHPVQEMR